MAKKKVTDRTSAVKKQPETCLFICKYPGVYFSEYALVNARSVAEAKRKLTDRLMLFYGYRLSSKHIDARKLKFISGVDLIC